MDLNQLIVASIWDKRTLNDIYSFGRDLFRSFKNKKFIQSLFTNLRICKITGNSSLDSMCPTCVCCITWTIFISAGNALHPA